MSECGDQERRVGVMDVLSKRNRVSGGMASEDNESSTIERGCQEPRLVGKRAVFEGNDTVGATVIAGVKFGNILW